MEKTAEVIHICVYCGHKVYAYFDEPLWCYSPKDGAYAHTECVRDCEGIDI